MKVLRSVINLLLFSSLLFIATSCLEGKGNYQTMQGLTGSVVAIDGIKYFRSDNGYLFKSTEFNSYQVNDRLMASFTVNYDNQVNSSYYTVTEVYANKFPLLNITEIENDAADTVFSKDPLAGMEAHYISTQGSNIYLTLYSYYVGSSKDHTPVLIYNDAQQTNSDTLKLEYRIDKNGETGTTTYYNLTSFDLTNILNQKPSKTIQVKYNFLSNYYYYSYTNPLYSN